MTRTAYLFSTARLCLSLLCLCLPAAASAETLIVANKSDATVSLVNLLDGEVAATVPTGQGPHEVAVSFDGTTAVVTDYGTRDAPGSTLTVIDDCIESVVAAGNRRIRACLMTTATTVLALIPVLTSSGRGSDIMVPMAIPSFGGMLIEVMTMLVVPVLYCMREERRLKSRLAAEAPG